MTRTAGIAALAAVLGLAGIVLGSIALARGSGGSGSAFEEETLTLRGGKGTRVDFDAPVLVKGNPAGVKGWEANYPISGDATGEVTVTCLPLITKVEGSILGGSGAYDGTHGSFTVDWKTHVYTLHLQLPKQ